MIDGDDVDFVALGSLATNGPVSIVLLVIAIILFIAASANEEECSKKSCSAGHVPKLTDNECLCVERAK